MSSRIRDNAHPNRPDDTPFKQQRLDAWQPILTPRWVISIFIVIGCLFIIIGGVIKHASDQVVEYSIQYDGDGTDEAYYKCFINGRNETKLCNITFTVDKTMQPPIYVYYRLTNFYQNHRRYVSSYDANQLEGKTLFQDSTKKQCEPVVHNGDLTLNPCGMIANSMFNDIFTVTTPGVEMQETQISWRVDREHKYGQPEGFMYKQIPTDSCVDLGCTCEQAFGGEKYKGCKNYTDQNGIDYKFWYPNDDSIQYLYESYPEVVNPLEGVKNEHFIVWMKVAPLPSFRKKYGIIHQELKEGTTLEFNLRCHYWVDSFQGTKSLVISTRSWFGDKNSFLGIAYLVVGCFCIALAVAFAIQYRLHPRKLGDSKFLVWKDE